MLMWSALSGSVTGFTAGVLSPRNVGMAEPRALVPTLPVERSKHAARSAGALSQVVSVVP